MEKHYARIIRRIRIPDWVVLALACTLLALAIERAEGSTACFLSKEHDEIICTGDFVPNPSQETPTPTPTPRPSDPEDEWDSQLAEMKWISPKVRSKIDELTRIVRSHRAKSNS